MPFGLRDKCVPTHNANEPLSLVVAELVLPVLDIYGLNPNRRVFERVEHLNNPIISEDQHHVLAHPPRKEFLPQSSGVQYQD